MPAFAARLPPKSRSLLRTPCGRSDARVANHRYQVQVDRRESESTCAASRAQRRALQFLPAARRRPSGQPPYRARGASVSRRQTRCAAWLCESTLDAAFPVESTGPARRLPDAALVQAFLSTCRGSITSEEYGQPCHGTTEKTFAKTKRTPAGVLFS